VSVDVSQPLGVASPPSAPGAGPLRVGHLIASNFAGGPEKQILGLSVALAAHGWSSVIGSFRERRDQVEILDLARARGFETFMLDTRCPYSPAAAVQLRRSARRGALDVLVTHGYKANLIGALANWPARYLQLPILRGYTAEDAKLRLYEAIDRRLLRRFPRVLCVSDATRRLAIGFGLRPERLAVLHNAIDAPRAVSPRDLRAEFQLPAGARLLVAAGRLSREKGHHLLIAALEILRAESPPIALLIFGSGREAPTLRAQIAAAGLDTQIKLGGFEPDILPVLAAADLVVNPSLTEGLPNVLLEALALRRPVVATAVGGVAELVAPGERGRLVAAGDPGALAAAIRAAFTEPQRTAALAEAGYRHLLAEFTFARQADVFMRLCHEALATHGPAGLARRHAVSGSAGPGNAKAPRRQPGRTRHAAVHGG
jgi:glycosyltransferase involved in cell wall biosynthesis